MTLSQKFFLTASKPSRRSISAAKRREKEKKGRRKKIPKIEKPKDVGHFLLQKLSQNFDFCACLSHNALKRDAGGKKGKLLCCKRFFNHIKGNLAKIQPKNHQNVQKMHFFARSSRSQRAKVWNNKFNTSEKKNSFNCKSSDYHNSLSRFQGINKILAVTSYVLRL